MKLGYELILEQSQKLVMTPELIQAIKILQFTSQELDVYVADQLMANPVLELDEQSPAEKETAQDQAMEVNNPEDQRECDVVKDEAFDWSEHIREREYDDISYRQFQTEPVAQDYSYEQYLSKDISLTEYLMTQMQFICLNTEACRVAKLIIEALDENGYLTLSTREIAELASVDPAHIDEALVAVQSLDPPGVGARDLRECLLLQLKRKGQDDEIALRLISDHLEDIARNRIAVIARANALSAEDAQDYCDRIRSLEPKPGRQFGSSQEVRYVSADVSVEKVGSDYLVILNEKATPQLSISSYYRKVLTEADPDSQITDFLNKRLNAAVWLIKSIEQRKRTIYNVVTAIVNHQKDFFDQGTKHLKPMTLAEIADEAGVHESTVSRAVNGKYVQTPRGLFELKYFFTGGVLDDQGAGVGSESVKELLKEMIAGEDPHAPCSDQIIVKRLKEERGINLSRRTVAKYRDELQIPASSKRKRY
ncbi:MAG: RNA polymerase factor sigma-54 [Eubacteriales bacterium]|nr:RNA polymerase factor sigma-54 [Eubacteriales bacterium]MDD3863136.1 RNA polymerase factor sigma-54 [Eubacteriales bacterium]